MHPYRDPQPLHFSLPRDGDVVVFEGKLMRFRRGALRCTSYSADNAKRTEHITLYLEDLDYERRRAQ